jgi:hypothetical protein
VQAREGERVAGAAENLGGPEAVVGEVLRGGRALVVGLADDGRGDAGVTFDHAQRDAAHQDDVHVPAAALGGREKLVAHLGKALLGEALGVGGAFELLEHQHVGVEAAHGPREATATGAHRVGRVVFALRVDVGVVVAVDEVLGVPGGHAQAVALGVGESFGEHRRGGRVGGGAGVALRLGASGAGGQHEQPQ